MNRSVIGGYPSNSGGEGYRQTKLIIGDITDAIQTPGPGAYENTIETKSFMIQPPQPPLQVKDRFE